MTASLLPGFSNAPPARRPVCASCLRPQAACICQWITQLAPGVEVLILQHPLEVTHAKGSARLLHLSLPGSTLLVGENFDLEHQAPSTRRDVLLYPDTPMSNMPVVQPLSPCEPAQLRLIVLDATWRKSRRMLHLNPRLQQLPRLSLKDVGTSNYRIRKAHGIDQLSTLEATCRALAELESDAEKYLPLLKAFDGFVAQQAGLATQGAQSPRSMTPVSASPSGAS